MTSPPRSRWARGRSRHTVYIPDCVDVEHGGLTGRLDRNNSPVMNELASLKCRTRHSTGWLTEMSTPVSRVQCAAREPDATPAAGPCTPPFAPEEQPPPST